LAQTPDDLPAKLQLCQDLLRLGQEEKGWDLAAEVFKEDPYNVLAYNLVTLHDTLGKFKEIKNEHFVLRMEPREAQIFGERAMRLLERGRAKLCEKYGVTWEGPISVEIFNQQKDFAVRTFGMPGGDGFLGVCFVTEQTKTKERHTEERSRKNVENEVRNKTIKESTQQRIAKKKQSIKHKIKEKRKK